MDRICYLVFGVKIPLYLQYALPLLIFYGLLSSLIKNKYLRFLLILIPPTIIFIRLLRNDPFFLSDDFAHLKLVSENSYFDIARSALTGSGIWVGHRIIGAFWLFKGIFEVFGTKTEAYLAANYIFHSINILLFYLITQRLKKTSWAILTAFLLGSYYLTWISNMHEIMGATFALLTTFFWVSGLSGQKKVYLYAIFSYVLAILTKEITFVLPISLGAIAIFYHANVSRLNAARIIRALVPFAVIFIIYLFTYASGFINYRGLPSQDSYKIGLDFPAIAENFLFYGGYLFPIVKSSLPYLIVLFSSFIFFDLIKRKAVMTPFLISFFTFLGPSLLFEKRVSIYYSYIAAFFLFIGLSYLLAETYLGIKRMLSKKPGVWTRIFNVYFILIIGIGVFKLNKLFMDNCFLIQYTWKNELKGRIVSLTNKIEGIHLKEEIEGGSEINLEEAEISEDMKFVYESETLQLFLRSERLKGFKYTFIEERGILLVEVAP